MSYNGSGTFQINTSGQPVVTGTSISSTVFNALTADLATGLSTAITKDGQTTTTARIPFALGINSTLVTDATNTTSGSIITAGGVGIAKAVFIGTTLNVAGASTMTGSIAVDSVIDSSSTTTGSIQTDGGVGIAKALFVGTTANIAGNTTLSGGTANGVAYLNGSKVLTTGTALVFDGTNFGIGPSTSGLGKIEIQQQATTAGLWVQSGGTTNSYVIADFRNGSNASAFKIFGNARSTFLTTLGVGEATPSTSGAGITFPATQSASSDANTLDDYEEGTWTPNSTGITVVGTFSSSGIYTKIGRVVTVIATFAGTTSVAVAAGAAFSTNIPIASGNLGIDNPGTFFRFGQSGGEIIVAANDTRFYAGQAIGASGGFQVSCTYFV